MTNDFFRNLLFGYRETAAFISAWELGIFQHMQGRAVCVDELSRKLHADKTLLGLFLRYLESIGLVETLGGLWKLKDGFGEETGQVKKYGEVIAHEKNLINRWLTPAYITSSVVRGPGERQFDRDGFSPGEMDTYFKAMNGRNLDLIAFWIAREMAGKQGVKYLEFGRSIGALSLSLKNRIKDIDITIVLDGKYLPVFNSQVRDGLASLNPRVLETGFFNFSGRFELICMYNTIHYYPWIDAVKLLNRLRDTMNEDSVICVADIFLKGSDKFTYTFIPDWITHGGVYNLETEDIESIFGEAGLKITKRKNLNEISTDLIIGARA